MLRSATLRTCALVLGISATLLQGSVAESPERIERGGILAQFSPENLKGKLCEILNRNLLAGFTESLPDSFGSHNSGC